MSLESYVHPMLCVSVFFLIGDLTVSMAKKTAKTAAHLEALPNGGDTKKTVPK